MAIVMGTDARDRGHVRPLHEGDGLGGLASQRGRSSSRRLTPRVDISETDKEFAIKAEIPDVQKEDVKVSVDNGVVTIQGERKQEKEEKGKKFHRVERYYGSFVRSFTLPDNIDEANIKASFKDGMLNLQIPKSAVAKPKSIEVKVE